MLDLEKDNDNVKLSLAAAYLPAFLTWCVGAGRGWETGRGTLSVSGLLIFNLYCTSILETSEHLMVSCWISNKMRMQNNLKRRGGTSKLEASEGEGEDDISLAENVLSKDSR